MTHQSNSWCGENPGSESKIGFLPSFGSLSRLAAFFAGVSSSGFAMSGSRARLLCTAVLWHPGVLGEQPRKRMTLKLPASLPGLKFQRQFHRLQKSAAPGKDTDKIHWLRFLLGPMWMHHDSLHQHYLNQVKMCRQGNVPEEAGDLHPSEGWVRGVPAAICIGTFLPVVTGKRISR